MDEGGGKQDSDPAPDIRSGDDQYCRRHARRIKPDAPGGTGDPSPLEGEFHVLLQDDPAVALDNIRGLVGLGRSKPVAGRFLPVNNMNCALFV